MMDKSRFNSGDCAEFAEAMLSEVKKTIPGAQLGLIRALVKGDEYEQYKDTEYQDCHAVVKLSDELYIDVDGLTKFDHTSDVYAFNAEPIRVEMINFKDIKREDYAIYREYDGEMGCKYLDESIYANFGKVQGGGELDQENIEHAKGAASQYIEQNLRFFKKAIKEGRNKITPSKTNSQNKNMS